MDVAVRRYLNLHNEVTDDIVLLREGKEYTYEQVLDMAEVIADE